MNGSCVCTGIRSCSVCATDKSAQERIEKNQRGTKILPVQTERLSTKELESVGAFLFQDFVTLEEEVALAAYMDAGQWVPSQSGRRKQDFGPKANFKRRKAKLGDFRGIPEIMFPIFDRIRQVHPHLADFEPVECLFLEYCPENGAHIDPHFVMMIGYGEEF